MCSCFIELLHRIILLEEPKNGETGLSSRIPLQLLHLCLDYQVNRFMGCDCHIEALLKERKPERHLLAILKNVHHWVGYTRHFGPPSGADPKLCDAVLARCSA